MTMHSIGADELEDMMSALGIHGADDHDVGDIGDIVGAFKRLQAKGKMGGGLPKRNIVANSVDGRARQFPLLMSRSVALADGAAAVLTGTANRRALLTSLFIMANSAAGAPLLGVLLTAMLINGRNAVIGTGFAPVGLMFGDFAQSTADSGSWRLGVIDQGGTADLSIQNEAGAAIDLYAGFRAETTD